MNKIRLLFSIFGIVSFSAFGAEFPTFDVNAVLAQAVKKKKYVCGACQKVFTTSSHLQRHLRAHSEKKPFKCSVKGCGKYFTRPDHLKDHAMTHSGKKPFRCMAKGCRKAFAKSSNLKNHLRTHSGEKPYKCQICKKAFARSCALRRHEGTQHEGLLFAVGPTPEVMEAARLLMDFTKNGGSDE